MNRLKGKIIVVTGGSGLIGKAIIDEIIAEGGIAINFDIKFYEVSKVNNIFCDISDKNSISAALKIVLNKFKKIDGWVNNAYPKTEDWGEKFEDINLNSWNKNIDLQLNSVFICCQLVLKRMKIQGYGNIVNIASIYGLVGPDFSIYENTNLTMPAAYSAIKGGVINFSRYLASYFGKFGIRINCISPGGVFNNQNKNFVKNYTSRVPLKKMAQPKDIAPSVIFLLSDSASYITGHNLLVDGGWTCI